VSTAVIERLYLGDCGTLRRRRCAVAIAFEGFGADAPWAAGSEAIVAATLELQHPSLSEKYLPAEWRSR
jgi:hypothetical protein